MSTIIEPKVLKGFRDFLPDQEIKRRKILTILEGVFRNYGYVPIDTPVLEYTEVLLGKGGGETDKQVYAFTDHGNRQVAMRFDLTVPFARYMAAHSSELPLPFKRFHFGKVYRGENTQRGRYREFMQCDFDCVGVDSASADLEILLMIRSAFVAIDISNVTIRLSHRGIFNRFLQTRGLLEKSVEILRIVDKLAKIGPEQTAELLSALANPTQVQEVLSFIGASTTVTGGNLKVLARLEELAGGIAEDSQRIREILGALEEMGLNESFVLDSSITRGLDYYTGIVYETFLNQLPGIGSVCSGGRYNDLASLYTKEQLPGVGSSIGLDRLMAALEELGILGGEDASSQVMLFAVDPSLTRTYHRVAEALRAQGISAEVYLAPKKVSAQFAYAEKKHIPWGLFIGPKEAETDTLQLKNLETRETWDGIDLSRALELLRG